MKGKTIVEEKITLDEKPMNYLHKERTLMKVMTLIL